jgi:uncharacterized protein (DUF1810 family)
MTEQDPHDLKRFIKAQENVYPQALRKLKSGKKRTHWMWFIFPQIDGLGFSLTSQYYAIKRLDEARQYLQHPILGKRLLECVEAVLGVEGRTVSEIFDDPDDLKLQSSMTLFAAVAEQPAIFLQVLNKYFGGEKDAKSLHILAKLGKV